MADRARWRRRAVLAGGALAVIGWVKGAPYLATLGRPELAFAPLPGLAPFRELQGAGAATTGGGSPTGNVALLGLDTPAPVPPEVARLRARVRADPCRAFFGAGSGGAGAPVPVAMFSDFACPICQLMEQRLQALKAEAPQSFRIVRHQLPILGVASDTASRAVLAAGRQGAYAQMHARLLRTPAVTDTGYVTALAENIGLDRAQFAADMASDRIGRDLKLSRAIADVFGFYGTPAFAVGRTVFTGALPKTALAALIAEEAATPGGCG